MSTRLYKVGIGGHVHLVEAKTQAQAIRHVTKGKVSASLVTALETAKFMQEGHTVEVAGEEKDEEGAPAAEAVADSVHPDGSSSETEGGAS